jgi:glycosyltransferase involved in cell wall biosynthesis
MNVFYKPFARVFSRSNQFIDEMRRVGISDEKMLTLQSGIDTEDFGERYRDRSVWTALGVDAQPDPEGRRLKVLYCGRVSVEKNLPLLTRIWKRVRQHCASRGIEAQLVVVGDGPYRREMELELKGHDAHFVGFRHGEELATLYASSDAFIFPSVTDTLGQSVMEAQASGVPALVSDQGGPKSIVRDGESGYVLPGGESEPWVQALLELLTDGDRRSSMRVGALEAMRGRDIRDSFAHYWSEHEAVWTAALAEHGITPKSAASGGSANGRSRAGQQANGASVESAAEPAGDAVEPTRAGSVA